MKLTRQTFCKKFIAVPALLLMGAMLAGTLCANGQPEVGNVSLKPMAGAVMATMTNTGDAGSAEKMPRWGYTFGGELVSRTSEYIGYSVGLLYTTQGCRYKMNGTSERYTYKLNYLNIPLLLNYYLSDELVLKGGIQMGTPLSASIGVKQNGVSMDVDMKDAVKELCLYVPIGFSYETRKGLVIDFRYNWGLSNVERSVVTIQGRQYANDENRGRHSVFMLTLGYRFKL